MTKDELINTIAESTGETKAAVSRVVASLQDEIIGAVAKGDEVSLTGFVAFTPAVRAARTMRNPRTGEEIQVPETKVVKIRAMKRFRDEVAS